nr:Tn3 family transposase [Streptosporangium minutum]
MPEEQEKLIKLNTLLLNLVVFHNALDISDIVRDLVAGGWSITADQLGQIAPYLRAHISRFDRPAGSPGIWVNRPEFPA